MGDVLTAKALIAYLKALPDDTRIFVMSPAGNFASVHLDNLKYSEKQKKLIIE